MVKTYIIAEAGVNHNGNEEMALQLIDAAAAAGADAVKFQSFKAEHLVTDSARQADYQKLNTAREESQFAMLKRLELSDEAHLRLAEYCRRTGIAFMSTAFDYFSLRLLVEQLHLPLLKIPSGEITNAPLLLEHARTRRNLIVSTGMCSLSDIEAALGVIAFGFCADNETSPSPARFKQAYDSKAGQLALQQHVTLLHCTTEYPAPPEDIHLRAMQTMKEAFNLPVGYSDHSEGIVIPTAAVATGACIIEKHFTLDRNLPGPDHKASLEPAELKAMVDNIRIVEKALGRPEKKTQSSELKNIKAARKSLVAACDIAAGDVFSAKNLAIKRPGDGVTPYHYWHFMGKEAVRSYHRGDLIID